MIQEMIVTEAVVTVVVVVAPKVVEEDIDVAEAGAGVVDSGAEVQAITMVVKRTCSYLKMSSMKMMTTTTLTPSKHWFRHILYRQKERQELTDRSPLRPMLRQLVCIHPKKSKYTTVRANLALGQST